MKIATFNINNVNKRLANLLGWLQEARPDVACLQELKASDSEFPIAAFEKAGYGAVWRGERSWNGVAILARGCEPVVTNLALPGNPSDAQSRYVEAAVHGVLIGTLYAPNGNPQPGPKFDYKLLWMKRLLAHAEELFALNIVTETEIAKAKAFSKGRSFKALPTRFSDSQSKARTPLRLGRPALPLLARIGGGAGALHTEHPAKSLCFVVSQSAGLLKISWLVRPGHPPRGRVPGPLAVC
jgi:hypothetical protein